MKLIMAFAMFGLAAAAPAPNDRLAMIAEIQATPGVLWTAGVTRFGLQPVGASKILQGVTPEAMAKRVAYAKSFKHEQLQSIDTPKSFDSETNWPQCAKVISDIRDQSMCGCCWAFGAASAASDRLCIATNGTATVPLSAEDVCFCSSSDGCQGGDISTPWDYIGSAGAVTGGQYKGSGPMGKGFCQDFSLVHCHHHGPQGKDPYPAEGAAGCPEQTSAQCPSKCDAAATAPHSNFTADKWSFEGGTQSANGEDAIMQAIMTGGPVETAFDVYDDFENYVSGIYSHVTGKMGGGHAVRIVGWGVDSGTKYWKVANSWNPYWGEKGYFRIKKGNNECGIENQVTFSAATAKWSQGSHGPAPGGCDAQKDEADCKADGCEWLAGIHVCIDKGSAFFGAQSALADARAKQPKTNATSGYYSFTFTGDGCGGQCPKSGCYEEDLDCKYCLSTWHSAPPNKSYKYNEIVSHGCAGKKVDCPECQGMMGLSRYDK